MGVLLFLAVPSLVYLIYPPSLKASDEVPAWAARELAEMGRLTPKELTMAAVAMLALGLWVLAGSWLNPTTTALIALGVLTPYATGPAPIYFGSGYISRKDFWRLGSIFGAIFLTSLLAVGVPYLLALAP